MTSDESGLSFRQAVVSGNINNYVRGQTTRARTSTVQRLENPAIASSATRSDSIDDDFEHNKYMAAYLHKNRENPGFL